jgi:hypothetical protein
MTTFLWIVIIAMATALLAEILAFVGMALVVVRASRRVGQVMEQVKQQIEPAHRTVSELKTFIEPRVANITKDSKEMGTLVASRLRTIEATIVDTTRRAERIHLRLIEGVQTVGETQGRRRIYRDVVEPIQAASQVLRGLKLALWILRKVA